MPRIIVSVIMCLYLIMKGATHMKNHSTNPIRFWSKLSGLSLIIMALAAGYAYGFVFNHFYVPNNPSQTVNNILALRPLFFSGVAAWCLILISDLIVSYGFYRFLKPIRPHYAIASGLLRLIYSLFLAVAIIFLFTYSMDRFLVFWSMGLFILGFHLIITGLGSLYAPNIPKVFGFLLILAGSGYSLIHGLENFIPQAEALAASLEMVLAIPMTIGELSFGVWLLVRGGKIINLQPLDA